MDSSKSVLALCLNPTFEMTMVFDSFYENEVNRSAEHFICPSGKGVNVARVLTQLGVKACAFTHLGGARVDEFINLCAAEKIPLVHFPAQSPIRTCVTIVNKSGRTSTELVEDIVKAAVAAQ